MNYRSFNQLNQLINDNIYKIPFDVDLIVGIPRSGLLVANIIALKLNKCITDFEGYFENRIISVGKTKNINKKDLNDYKKVLIVEDSVSSGKSINECREKISTYNHDAEILYFAVFVEPGKEKLVDIFLEVLPQPRVFEWNIFHHKSALLQSCCDVDGVLCLDPTAKENDDGDNYRRFLQAVQPKFLPTTKIDKLVTSRLEKYREETIKWLNKYNIEYNELIMFKGSAQERREKGLHAKFKAEIYKKSSDTLFIESEINQAIEINRLTGKPVYCVANNEIYDGSKLFLFKQKSKNKIKAFLMKFKFIVWLNSKRRKHRNGAK